MAQMFHNSKYYTRVFIPCQPAICLLKQNILLLVVLLISNVCLQNLMILNHARNLYAV
jgi:hypothetical protein